MTSKINSTFKINSLCSNFKNTSNSGSGWSINGVELSQTSLSDAGNLVDYTITKLEQTKKMDKKPWK